MAQSIRFTLPNSPWRNKRQRHDNLIKRTEVGPDADGIAYYLRNYQADLDFGSQALCVTHCGVFACIGMMRGLKAEVKMPHGVRFMHVFLFACLIIAILATLLFVIAGFGKPKK